MRTVFRKQRSDNRLNYCQLLKSFQIFMRSSPLERTLESFPIDELSPIRNIQTLPIIENPKKHNSSTAQSSGVSMQENLDLGSICISLNKSVLFSISILLSRYLQMYSFYLFTCLSLFFWFNKTFPLLHAPFSEQSDSTFFPLQLGNKSVVSMCRRWEREESFPTFSCSA